MKERLTGAIILVVLIVLLVPELLSGPKGPSTSSSAAPSAASEEPPLRSYTINLGDDSHPQTAASGNGPSMPQPATPEQSSPANATSEATPTSDSASPVPPPSQVSAGENSKAPTDGGKATQQAEGLGPTRAETAHPSAQTSPKTKPAPAHPVSNAVTAKSTGPKASAHVAATSGHVAKPVQAASHAENRAESRAGAWGVQLGVFASHENAERLAGEVRAKGFKASVSPLTSGSRKLYRVRVGPAADRAAAQDLQSKLKAAGRPAGTVVPFS